LLARPGRDPCCVDESITLLTPNRNGCQGRPGTFVRSGSVFIPVNHPTAVDGPGARMTLRADWLVAWPAAAVVEIWCDDWFGLQPAAAAGDCQGGMSPAAAVGPVGPALTAFGAGAGLPQEPSDGDPGGVVGHPGSGRGIPAHGWWSAAREAARSPGQIISFGCGSEGTAGTRAPTRREAEIYIAAAEVHLRREIPPPDGYQVWHG
jgi:hypothetical protein